MFSIPIILFLTTQESLANVDCVTIRGGPSTSSDDSRAFSECPPTHSTMVSCGGATKGAEDVPFDGSFIDTTITPSRCYAQNGDGGTGVYAYARCCNFIPNDIECEYLMSAKSGPQDDVTISKVCGTNLYDTMTHCSAFNPWASIDGAYPGNIGVKPSSITGTDTHNYPGYNQCTAQNGANVPSDGGVYVNMACCSSPTYNLQCITRYGTPTYPYSTVSCPDDHFMAGCSAWGQWHGVNAWFISNDRCYGRPKFTGQDVYAVAICCRLETDSPTADPTSSPTPSPTLYPSAAPTSIPTLNPTLFPTTRPTRNPSQVPTKSPTENPTRNPTDTPTQMPSLFPTISPSENPSVFPTKTLTETPTATPTAIPSDNPTVTPSKTPTVSPIVDQQSEGEVVIIPTMIVPSPVTVDHTNAAVIGGLITALIFLVLCFCCLAAAFAYYIWRKKRKLRNQVDDIGDGESGSDIVSVVSSIHPIEGGQSMATISGTRKMTNNGGYDTIQQGEDKKVMMKHHRNEQLNLLGDHSTDDDDDDDEEDEVHGIQQPYNNNNTRGLSLDEDEDVLPKSVDGDHDEILR